MAYKTTIDVTTVLVAVVLSAVLSVGASWMASSQLANALRTEMLSSTGQKAEKGAIKTNNRALVVHITSPIDNEHPILMGLMKANKSAELGYDVQVLFDSKSTKTVVEGQNLTYEGIAMSSSSLLDELQKNGAEIYVCEMCLGLNGNTLEEVREGVKIASPGALLEFAPGKDIVVLDY